MLAFLETGAFIGLHRAGRDGDDRSAASSPARARSRHHADRDRLGRARSRATAPSYYARPPPRARLPGPARRRGSRSPRSGWSRSRRSSTSHGGKAIFIGRFVGLVRASRRSSPARRQHAVPALPALRRARRRALGDDVHACSATSSGRASTRVLKVAKRGRARARASRSAVVVGIVWLVRWLQRRPENRGAARAASARQPRSTGPVPARCLRAGRAPDGLPRARCASSGAASRPGELGLELTTLLAIAAVGSFAFFGYWIMIAARRGPGGRRRRSNALGGRTSRRPRCRRREGAHGLRGAVADAAALRDRAASSCCCAAASSRRR